MATEEEEEKKATTSATDEIVASVAEQGTVELDAKERHRQDFQLAAFGSATLDPEVVKSAQSSMVMTAQEYEHIIEVLSGWSSIFHRKENRDGYDLEKKIALVTDTDGTKRLRRKEPKRKKDQQRWCVHQGQMFDIIHQAHTLTIPHQLPIPTYEMVKESYWNISRELVKTFCKVCPTCQNRKRKTRKDKPPQLAVPLEELGEMGSSVVAEVMAAEAKAAVEEVAAEVEVAAIEEDDEETEEEDEDAKPRAKARAAAKKPPLAEAAVVEDGKPKAAVTKKAATAGKEKVPAKKSQQAAAKPEEVVEAEIAADTSAEAKKPQEALTTEATAKPTEATATGKGLKDSLSVAKSLVKRALDPTEGPASRKRKLPRAGGSRNKPSSRK